MKPLRIIATLLSGPLLLIGVVWVLQASTSCPAAS